MSRLPAIFVSLSLVACSQNARSGGAPPPDDQETRVKPVRARSAGGEDVNVVVVQRGGASRRDTKEDTKEAPMQRFQPNPPPPRRDAKEESRPQKQSESFRPQKEAVERRPQKAAERPPPPSSGSASMRVACTFDQGFVAILPARLFDPGEEFLMQALIGFTEEPTFWRGIKEFKKYEPFRATPCNRSGRTFNVRPGKYVIVVGRAGQFSVRGEYKDNGFIRRVTLGAGLRRMTVSTADLKHTWLCISCPYLVVVRGGEEVDVGQVLVDRYTRRRYGTDVVTTTADVRDGVLTVRLDEREPEVSRIDAVIVRLGGRVLAPADRVPAAVRAVDDATSSLRMGESLTLRFNAAGVEDGTHEVEIAVSGHYEPIGPLL